MSRSQLAPLATLRWRMVRTRRARFGFGLLAAALPALCLAAVAVGMVMPREQAFDVTLLAPTAYLSVALLAVLGPLVAGGGNELFPPQQLVAYPVTARTEYVASLALTPLNLAWATQLVGLLGLTAYVSTPGPWLPLSVLVCVAYVGLVTVAGQSLAWLVIGLRARRRGRQLTWALAGAIVVLLLGLVALDLVGPTLDRTPTTRVVLIAITSSSGPSAGWLAVMAVLGLLTVAAHLGGARACSWALRRPGDALARFDSRSVRRRAQPANARSALLAVDRASVWRSPSLRRGLLVLAVLPGIAAATAGLSWSSLVLLPGLVSAGAGLLFGVNAFCLDGSGAVWLGALPHRPSVAFWSKTRVVAETCLVAITVTLVAGSLRADRPPTSAEAAALVAAAAVTLSRVVATCMDLSVRCPHRADLRGSRDTPAPPGVMAAYSARLAVSTTVLAVLFSALAEAGAWQWPVLFALPFVLLSLRRLVRAANRWADPVVRAQVLTVVSAG